MKKILIAFGCLLIPLISYAHIVEEKSINKALGSVDNETLVVFDLDSTVLEPAQTLGSDPWFYISLDDFVAKGMDKKEAAEFMLRKWVPLQRATEVKPVEKNTAEAIASLQKSGIKVVALTARSYDLAELTVKQLASIGVDFTKSTISGKDFDQKIAGDKVEFFHGIIFCGGDLETFYKGGAKAGKGIILNEILAKLKLSFNKITFLDDRKKNVDAVDKALADKGIDCNCIRYGAAEDGYKNYNPKLAETEMKFFGKILSDEAAKKIH